MYCGDNLLRDNKGTRYSCFKKGIGIGQRIENLEVYLSETSHQKIYCGNKIIPLVNTRFGKLSECLRKGIGIGKHISFNTSLQELIYDIDQIITEFNFRNL